MLSKSQRTGILVTSATIGIYLLLVQAHPLGFLLLLVAASLIIYHFRYNPAASALVNISQGNLERAKELLDEMGDPEKLPQHKKSCYYLAAGWMDLKTGDLDACEEKVLTSLEMGFKNQNDAARANLLLAKVCAGKGLSQNAQEYLNEAKQIEHNGLVEAEISQFEKEINVAIHYDLTAREETQLSRFEVEQQALINTARVQEDALQSDYEAQIAQLQAELEAKLTEVREQTETALAVVRTERDTELAKLEQERQLQEEKQIETIVALNLNEAESVQQAFEDARHTSQVAAEMFTRTLNNVSDNQTANYLKSQANREQRFQALLEQAQEQLERYLQRGTITNALAKLEAEYATELDTLQQLARLNTSVGQIIKSPTTSHRQIYASLRLIRAIKLRIRNSETRLSA